MSAQPKKNNFSLSEQPEEKNIDLQSKAVRPNIDHLLKRINTQRKQERNSNLFTMIVGIVGLAVVSFFLTQY